MEVWCDTGVALGLCNWYTEKKHAYHKKKKDIRKTFSASDKGCY